MGNGFQVTPQDLKTITNLVRGTAADLRSVRKSWDEKTGDGAAAFGTVECGKAHEALQDATFTSLGKHVDHLTSLADSVSDSALAYTGTDGAGERSFGGGD
ncbi:type VII secretion target [Actinokineospora iranica]|uniref:Excreted virulence factor EspC, type VII ESX diderm n=1 Tax=Actinokineospora iranica TaxID=1271860 RepID=A0A1G6WMZ8_9PSEU|nr:type VII secretion target [Actinokineospora iranica]SDD67228.1 Excreted virulence factor EspC, type VII ESX diderm [Actinokineospora iranica]